jgi:hypothetical protein
MVEATGGHTEGSMTVRVTTESGVATLCGDLIYNVDASLIERRGKYDAMEASLSREFTVSRRDEVGPQYGARCRARGSSCQPMICPPWSKTAAWSGASTAVQCPAPSSFPVEGR